MFKMMIVDDEPLVRKGIATSIDWSEYGIEVAGEAGNGRDALDRLSQHPVDLVLADIRMPVMSGIELSREIMQSYPDISVVLLSGYEEFAYAKAALQIGVENYLLKPADADHLVSVITDIRDRKLEERIRKRREIGRSQVFNENLPYFKFSFMDSLIKNELSAAEIEEKMRTLKIRLAGSEYRCLVIDIDDFGSLSETFAPKQWKALKYAVYNIAEETLQSYFPGFVCYGELNRLIALASTNPKHSIWTVCEAIQLNIRKYLKLSVTIGIGLPSESLSGIRRSYGEADRALQEKAYRGKGKVFMYSERLPGESAAGAGELRAILAQEEKSIVQYVKLMSVKELRQAADHYFAKMSSHRLGFEEIKQACVRLLTLLIQEAEESGHSVEPVFGPQFVPYVAVERFEVLGDLEQWIRDMLERILQHVKEQGNVKKIVKLAIQYAEEHYGQPITLQEVSDYVKVSPNYFSSVFSQEMGITFIKWLTQLRMEKAKALLKDTWLKTSEVAEKVGFSDYKYFSITFKKFAGCTPREYRNR